MTGPGGAGRLVLVATPIGNLGDLSPRAVATLAEAELVCCEDTRHTGRLLQHAGVRAKRLAVANDHTEAARVDEVLAVLGGGGDVAVVTDAGTPGISDPGERLVRAAVDAGFDVVAVPGPTAFVTALVASGLPTARFVFEGFLPRSGGARRERLAEIAAERRTVVLYEAPHRISRTLTDLAEACGPDRLGRRGARADQALRDDPARPGRLDRCRHPARGVRGGGRPGPGGGGGRRSRGGRGHDRRRVGGRRIHA